MSAFNEGFLLHDPVRKRWCVAGGFSEAEAVAWFRDCVTYRFFPVMRGHGLEFDECVSDSDARRFELLRNWIFRRDGTPMVCDVRDRVAVGSDVEKVQ